MISKRIPTLYFWICATLVLFGVTNQAQAFCGFYVSGSEGALSSDATQVVLMRDGTRTVLSMSNHYAGPLEDFAMVIPVPVVLQESDVKTLTHQSFEKINQLAAPRLVEYWEQDPCHIDSSPEIYRKSMTLESVSMEDSAGYPEDEPAVIIEAQFTVGEYEIVILSANDSMALDRWLRDGGYNIPEGAEAALAPYVESGMKFFVAKVDLDEVRQVDGHTQLSPLRFHYDSDTFSLPIRLGLLNSRGEQDLIIHVLARGQRYDVANYPNVTIPSNIGVHNEVREHFGEFYAALFDATLEKNPRAIVTEYAWASTSCDPCPGPTLDGQDLNIFGLDTLSNQDAWGFVLTRLHARYSAEQLKEDLIFRAVPPIVGGREHVTGPEGLERGATPSGQNNFQGRYIIRHAWEGGIACEHPVRGRWGGSPEGGGATPTTATDSAFAPRGTASLPRMVAENIPAIDLIASRSSGALKFAGPREGVGGVNAQGGCGHCGISRPTNGSWPKGSLLALFIAGLLWWRRGR